MEYLIIYGLAGLGLIISLVVQGFVTSSYKKYSKVRNEKGISGEKAARTILDKNGLNDVKVEKTVGMLSDHYDPRSKTIRLSDKVFVDTTIASVAVAVHECGHAIQHKEGYSFMKFRTALFPLVNFSTYAGYIAILIGAIFSLIELIWVGIALEFVILFFQLVTLPVELNASKRALKEIEDEKLLMPNELKGGKKMLKAAASTYIASIAVVILEIVRLIFMYGNRRD